MRKSSIDLDRKGAVYPKRQTKCWLCGGKGVTSGSFYEEPCPYCKPTDEARKPQPRNVWVTKDGQRILFKT